MKRAAGRAVVRRSGAAVAAVLLFTAGCADDDPPPRSAASIPEATAAPTTTNPDPYAVPSVIDEAYLSRVLAALDNANADAVRSSMREGAMTEESLQILRALYSGEALSERVNLLQDDTENGFRGYKPNPGSVKTAITKIISSTPKCAFVSVLRDYKAVAANPSREEGTVQYVGMRERPSAEDPDHRNPTPWIIVYDGFLESGSQPPDPCTASS